VVDWSSARYSLLYRGRSSSSSCIVRTGRPLVPKPLFNMFFCRGRSPGPFVPWVSSFASPSAASAPKESLEDALGLIFCRVEPVLLVAGRTTAGPSSSFSSRRLDASPLAPALSSSSSVSKVLRKFDWRKGFRVAFEVNDGFGLST
jgi:hypothetical protein